MSIEQSYDERARKMTDEARREFTSKLKEQFNALKECIASGQSSAISSANLARIIGQTIQGITGHENLLTAEFQQLSLVIPDASLNFAKECLSISHAHNNEISSYAVAKPIFDKLVVQLELLPKSKREEAKTKPTPVTPIEQFLHDVGALASRYAKIEKDVPIEAWPDFYKQTFLNESARIVAIRERILNV